MASQPVLALNCGSSSIKFAVFTKGSGLSRETDDPLLRGQVENIAPGLTPKLRLSGSGQKDLPTSCITHRALIPYLLSEVILPRTGPLVAVGHRVVHGGTRFDGPAILTPRIYEEIKALSPLAPSHQPHNLSGMDAVTDALPDVPQVACFDTAFHATIPEHRQRLPVAKEYHEVGLRRFGFHGLSYERIMSTLPDEAGERLVICHLGNGCSLAAVTNGQCAYTSMGFTPLEGLMMGRRPGRLDPGAVLWLIRQHDGDVDAVDALLNNQSGLLGVSGLSSDMRDLLASNLPEAALAIEMFVDRLAQEIASASAAIGGVDTIIFTGGIGENAAPIRARVVQALAWLGFDLDLDLNKTAEGRITRMNSRGSAFVVRTDEEAVIAETARALCGV